jgi:uncharacterized protein Yka (UPF0111/DUF47 family)
MDAIVEELKQIIDAGYHLAAQDDADNARLQHWLDERETIFRRLMELSAEAAEADRQTIGFLFQELLHLDATMLVKLEDRLDRLGRQITITRKLYRSLGAGAHFHPAPILQRTV